MAAPLNRNDVRPYHYNQLNLVVKGLAHKLIRLAVETGVFLADKHNDFGKFEILHVKLGGNR